MSPEDLLKLAGVTKTKAIDESLSAALGRKLPTDSLRSDEVWRSVAWLLLAVLAAGTLLAGRVHA